MTRTDDELVADLRARVDAALPTMTLDVAATARSARRRTHVRRVAAAGVTVAVAAAVAITAGQLVTPPEPAPPAQPARSIGPDHVVELLSGVTATNTPEPLEGVPGVWDLGLTFSQHDGTDLAVLLEAEDPTLLAGTPLGSVAEAGLRIGAQPVGRKDSPPSLATLQWHASEQDPATATELDAMTETVSWLAPDEAGFPVPSSRWFVGALPLGLEAPRVLLSIPWGTQGSAARTVELPTFRDPTGSGRLLYAALVGDPVPNDAWSGAEVGVFAVGGDGGVVDLGATCGHDVPSCLAVQPDGGASLLDGLAGLGADVDGLRPGEPPATVTAPVVPVPGLHASVGPAPGDATNLGLFDDVTVWLLAQSGPTLTSLAYRDGALLPAHAPDEGWTWTGTVPPGHDDDRAFLYVRSGVPSSDGARVHAVGIPTFAQPSTAGPGSMYLFRLSPPLARELEQTESWVVFVDRSGTIFDPSCEGGCAPLDPDMAAAVASAVG